MKAVLAALAFAFSLACPAQADPIDRLVERQMMRSRIPGLAVAVIESGKVTKLQGYGSAALEWGAKVNPDTPFQLASGTKVFTGVLIMRLVERGDIRLDDSIDRYFEGAPPEWKNITVRHLAQYTSGLPWVPGIASTSDVAATISEAMKLPLAYPTGSDSQYILTNMVVMKALLEKATGLSYETLLDREIVKPLGLTATRFNHMVDEPGNMRVSQPIAGRAVVYTHVGPDLVVREGAYNPATYAGGGLFSSAADIARLFAAIDGGGFLTPASMADLTTPPTLTSGKPGGFAIGWSVRPYRGKTLAGHSGGPALADIWRVPSEKLTVVVLTNYHRFYPLLAEAILDTTLPPRAARQALPDSAPHLTQLFAAAVASAEKGTIDTTLFSDAGRQGAASYWNGFGQGYLAAMGPMRSAALIGEQAKGDLLTRTYAVRFEEREGLIDMTTTSAGAIQSLYPISEK